MADHSKIITWTLISLGDADVHTHVQEDLKNSYFRRKQADFRNFAVNIYINLHNNDGRRDNQMARVPQPADDIPFRAKKVERTNKCTVWISLSDETKQLHFEYVKVRQFYFRLLKVFLLLRRDFDDFSMNKCSWWNITNIKEYTHDIFLH